MKKLQLTKAAIDFAFANYQLGAVERAEKSIQAFKAAGGVDADLKVWDNTVTQQVIFASQLANQKLPSEIVAQTTEAKTPVSNATAATLTPATEAA